MWVFMRVPVRLVIAAILLAASPFAAKAKGPDDIPAINRQVEQLREDGKYAQALTIAETVLKRAESELGKDHPDTLTSLNTLANLYRDLARFDDAEPLYARALESRERVFGKDHPDTLTSVSDTAELYQARGRYTEAEQLHKRALEARERTLGKDHPDTLKSINQLAVLYGWQGIYSDAEALHRRALEARERTLGKDHKQTLSSVNNLALVLEAQGRYSEAEPLYKRALDVRERLLGGDHPETLTVYNNLAVLYTRQGRYDEAEPLYRRNLEARERVLGPDNPNTIGSVNNLASFYSIRGRFADAEPLYKRGLEANERVLGKDHPATLVGLTNLAIVYTNQKRFAEAEDHYLRAISAQERTLGKDHAATLLSITNLASLYQKQERYDEAEPRFRRAFETSGRVLGEEHQFTLTSLANLGNLYTKQERFAEAEPLLLRALAARERVLPLNHPDVVSSEADLAELYFAKGDWQRAAEFWRRSTAMLTEHTLHGTLATTTGLTGRRQGEAERRSKQFRGLIKAAQQLSPSPDPATSRETFQSAQWATGSEAAASLAQMAARGTKGDLLLAGIVRERQDLVAEWQRRDALRNASLGQAKEKRNAKAEIDNLSRIAAIDTRVAEIDKTFATQFPDYAALASPQPLSVEEAQALLGPDEALVLFLDTDDKLKPAPEETFIWVVTKTGMRWVRSALGQAKLAVEVQALRCGLDLLAWTVPDCSAQTGQSVPGALLPFDHERAYKLYKQLFGQVEDLIEDKHLLVIPSGALTQLPFQVLVTAKPPISGDHRAAAWLVRDHAVTVLPAVSSLKALRKTGRPSTAAKPLIGFGNPLLDGPDQYHVRSARLAQEKQKCADTTRPVVVASAEARSAPIRPGKRGPLVDVSDLRLLAPLPETADELCAVARDVNADLGDIYLGARATEREVKALSETGRLAQYRILHFATHGAMAGDLDGLAEPGLVMTPPAQASEEDDGYLSASEISALKLDADWVILSACNTAAGNAPNAEALSGLTRAFIYAQARTLLVSHWTVDSNATVKLISSAIAEISRDSKAGRAEALRRAMIALIDKGEPMEAHPAFWAPFVVVGEGSR